MLHDEVRPPALGHARVEDLGHVGVIHHGQRLLFGLKASDHRPRVHPRLDDLEGHPPPHRLDLLGQVDHAEPALAEDFEQFVWADESADHLLRHALSLGPAPLAIPLASPGLRWSRLVSRCLRQLHPLHPPKNVLVLSYQLGVPLGALLAFSQVLPDTGFLGLV